MNTCPQGQNGRQSRWAPPEQGNAYQRGIEGGGPQAHASSRSKPPMPQPNGNNWWDMHTSVEETVHHLVERPVLICRVTLPMPQTYSVLSL